MFASELTQRRYRALVAALLAASASAALACSVLVPLDEGDDPAPAPDAAPDTGEVLAPDAEADAPLENLACGPVPQRPVDAGGPDLDSMVFAGIELAFDRSTAPEPALLCAAPGFDFDRLDTRSTPTTTKCELDRSCKPVGTGFEKDSCDYPGGRDDALLRLYDYARDAVPGATSNLAFDFTRLIATGTTTPLIELNRYNGEDDDDDVTVTFYAAAGYERQGVDAGPVDAAPPTADAFAELPNVWDGGQQDLAWRVDERWTAGAAGELRLPAFVATGYVRNRVLVAFESNGGLIPLGVPVESALRYRTGVFTAFLERPGSDGRMRLTHGRHAIRIAATDLLAMVGSLRAPNATDHSPMCDPNNAADYQVVRAIACGHLDLPQEGASNDAMVECAELSGSFGLAAVESKLASVPNTNPPLPVVVPTRAPERVLCPDDGGTPWCDDCAWGGSSHCPRDGGTTD